MMTWQVGAREREKATPSPPKQIEADRFLPQYFFERSCHTMNRRGKGEKTDLDTIFFWKFDASPSLRSPRPGLAPSAGWCMTFCARWRIQRSSAGRSRPGRRSRSRCPSQRRRRTCQGSLWRKKFEFIKLFVCLFLKKVMGKVCVVSVLAKSKQVFHAVCKE